MRFIHGLVATAAALAFSLPAQAGAYYLFDGDWPEAFVFSTDTGATIGRFATPRLAYPAAIRSSIWLGERDDDGGWEYTLQGRPTGRTSQGGHRFSQLLDGATGRGRNYGVECCGEVNSVTVANADWSGQRVLFKLQFSGAGIAFDPRDRSLYVSELRGTRIRQFSLDGSLLNSFDFQKALVGLAYDTATRSFWGFNRESNSLVQFDRRGTVLADLRITDAFPSNPYGGEMQVLAVPEPGALLLAAAGVPLLAGVAARRRARRHAA
ncbi:PEP-CTERM sorting domain-containing protein [Azohydromonas caseinilytica]|uniref:PEP-CTERM sorting domain-containing protein n=1 Tax=Azohydromonas caseinilytica TaxID=2728836 RepID=A0A848F5G9_9BURK|nr:PEP-CTERM sorting domain-containing protein [Azohydromonas caseinilytica]NML13839.1 PEP-CTERM sorting domain-containing protein [Azohydromonas caseinilytica]